MSGGQHALMAKEALSRMDGEKGHTQGYKDREKWEEYQRAVQSGLLGILQQQECVYVQHEETQRLLAAILAELRGRREASWWKRLVLAVGMRG